MRPISSRPLLLAILPLAAALSGLAPERAGAQTYQPPVDRWKAQDAVDPEPSGAVLFLGSSSIRRWEDLRRDFADYRVLQRGLGGSKLTDLIYHLNEIVLPYNPRAIVMWSGINDLIDAAAPATGEVVRDRFVSFANAVHAAQPGVDIFYIGIPRSPALEGDVPKTTQRLSANALISAHVAGSGNARLHYIDLPADFVSLSSAELNALYVDTLHMNRAGYESLWVPKIRAALGAVLAPDRIPAANPATLGPGGRLLFDFGPNDGTNGNNTASPDPAGNHWNNWVGGAGAGNVNSGEHIGNLKDSTGAATGIGLVITGGFLMNGKLNGGLLLPGVSLLGNLAVATATEDYFYSTADGLPNGGSDDTPGSFLLTGLDPNLLYDFKFFGSRSTTDTRSTTYHVAGANSGSATLVTTGNNIGANGVYDGNDDEAATVRGIKPNAFGEIFIDLTATQMSSNGTTTFAYINAMEVAALGAYEGWTRSRNLTAGTNDRLSDTPGAGGTTNLEHFAMDTDPFKGGGNEGKQLGGIVEDSGQDFLTFTCPVRRGAVFSGAPLTSTPIDGLVYHMLGDDNLQGADLAVVETSPGDTSQMPALGDYDGDGTADYEYRRFRLSQPVSASLRGFLWMRISPP